MVRIVPGIVAVVSMSCGAAIFAQEVDLPAAKEVAPAPDSVSELAIQFDLHSDGRWSTGRFARFSDLKVFLRLRNRGKEPRLLAIDEASRRWVATPDLVELEVTRDDGKPLVLPRFQIGTLFSGDRVEKWIWHSVPVRWLGAGGSLDWSIPLREVPGWQSIELTPGAYRIRAIYRGPPELPAHVHADTFPDPDAGAKAAWRGALVSSTLSFEITGSTSELTWSDPKDGLRIAPIPDPRGDRFMVGETIELATMLENVTDEPLDLVREVDYSQDDALRITSADGMQLTANGVMTTGINHRIRFTLPPHARLRIHAAPARIEGDRIVAGNHWFVGAWTGRFTLRQRIEIEAPAGSDRNFIEVPAREIELIARR
jgi:hypothetical protein